MNSRRLRACVEKWPECSDGEYNPHCCRFPKSCSCTVYDEEHVTERDLEPDKREWDVASCSWQHTAFLLDEGYEPFAVTTNGPNNAGEITVYLRRRRDTLAWLRVTKSPPATPRGATPAKPHG